MKTYFVELSIERNTTIVLAVVAFVVRLTNCSVVEFQRYTIHAGWTTDGASEIYSVESSRNCVVSIHMESEIPIGEYNKTSSACNGFTALPQILYLHQTDDVDNIVLLGDSICSHLNHVFKVYVGQDLFGYDLGFGQTSSIETCITYCEETHPDYKSIVFYHVVPPPSGGHYCHCKSTTRWEHPLNPRQEYSHYESICKNTL